MPPRNDFHFVLSPWEHRGARFDPRPDFVVFHQLDGVGQLFLLKVRANRIFFRLAEDETRVWATTGQMDDGPVPFWKREVEAQRFARLFERQAQLEFNSGGTRTQMATLINGAGEAWLCEWCSAEWWRANSPLILQKYARTHRKLGMWQPQWQPPLRKLMNHNSEAMFHRAMPDSERTNTALLWMRGSEKQLTHLLQCLCFACFDALHKRLLNDRYNRDSPYLLFDFTSYCIEREARLSFMSGFGKPLEILDVFLEHNRVEGVTWKRQWHCEGGGAIRGDWQNSSLVRYFNFQRKAPALPQRLQGQQILRQWLYDKVPISRVEPLLNFPD